MIYILQGKDEYFIRERLKELTAEEAEIIRIDSSSDTLIDEILDACLSPSLFHEKSVVLVKDPFFLIQKTEDLQGGERLLSYCRKPVYECDLVFYTLTDRFSSKLKMYKDIAANAEVKRYDGLQKRDFFEYGRSVLNRSGLDITPDAARYLLGIVRFSASCLQANIEVLRLYPGRIDINAVKALATENDATDNFDLINAILDREPAKAISAERKILQSEDSIRPLLSLLAGQLRFLYFVATLKAEGKRKEEIMSITSSKEFRITTALNTLQKLSREEIMSLLNDLHKIDILIKSDNSLSEIERFEMFILRMAEGV